LNYVEIEGKRGRGGGEGVVVCCKKIKNKNA
jgi:hypothetical protein